MEVFILKDDYTEDAGSTIYGVFSSQEKAEEALAILEDPERNPYGRNLNTDKTLEIESYTIDRL